jgi:hypothetical protein
MNGVRHRLVSRLRCAESVTSAHAADAGFAGVGWQTLVSRFEPIEVVMPAERADFDREWSVPGSNR